MGSTLSNTFKMAYSVLFTLSFVFVFINIDTANLFDFSKLILFLDYLLLILMAILLSIGSLIIQIVITISSALSRQFIIPFTDIVLFDLHFITPNSFGDTSGVDLSNIIMSIFPRSSLITTTASIETMITDFIQFWSILVAFILLPAIILSSLGFIMRGEAKLAITSFTAMQILVILAMYTPSMNSPTGRMMLINLNFPEFTGTLGSFLSDFILLIQTPVFQLGLALYLLLEIGFQTSYAISVVDPMIEREGRIKKHLQRIIVFQPQPEKDKKQTTSALSTSGKKYDLLAASYLREMIDKKLFKKGEQLDQKTTMRLQSFIVSTRRTDRNFENKITAKSAQPDTSALLVNAIPSIAFRVFVVIILSFIIINPNPIIDILITNPVAGTVGLFNIPQLADSLELNQPEFRTVLVFNLVLLLLFISAVAHWLLVHKPEVQEKHIKKVDTLVDFNAIKETPPVVVEEEN